MKTRKLKKIITISILLVVLSGSFLLFQSSSNDDFKLVKNLEIYYTLFRELNHWYVDDTDPEKLVTSSINGMLKETDPYTTYIPESDEDDFKFMTTGEYGGIGALIRKNGEYAIIAEPYKNFPAAVNGLIAGDTIVSIDGKLMKNLAITKISEHLKGKPGTPLVIRVKRYGTPGEIEKTITREKITVPNVPYYGMLEDGIAYIRLSNFTTDAGKEVKKAFIELKNSNDLTGVILDLRNNPGGLLIEAVDVANIFIESGQEIVSTKGRVNQWDYTYKTRYSPVDTEMPLAVLVNRISASASEIVAGSVQDLDRGVIIGQRTYGKGLVQTTRDLAYNSKLKLTTAKYYIPSGRCIQALDYSNRNEDGSVGIVPDSLISEFTTSNGRKVYDGGGIGPDIQSKNDDYSQFTVSLFTQNMLFDYATIYSIQHESIPELDQFIIDDHIYNDFKNFIKSRNFSYTTRSEDSLNELINIAKREKYYDLSKEEFDALQEKLAHNNDKDLNNFRDEISELLKQEIVSRYYYQWGQIRSSIDGDKDIDKAIEVLKNSDQYLTTLAVDPVMALAGSN
ncbi:MAG: S41 family peptidase [Bacteroidales bacterium]|nr:S41 family peptidase [Bacteroidales bacterium]